jgi:hypothetical protein
VPFWERDVTEMASAPSSNERDLTASEPLAVDPLATAAVTIADLQAAGFTSPEAVPPGQDSYQLPVYYFRVGEKSDEAAWATPPNDATNLVAVLVQRLSAAEAVGLPIGSIDYQQLYGRFQARTYRNGRYLVVTGPDGDKVASLIKLLEQKKF